jgi:nucleotide-binding universal stress UspA family protein
LHPLALKSRDQGEGMYTNILIPTDGSALSDKAVQHGIALAKQSVEQERAPMTVRHLEISRGQIVQAPASAPRQT